MAYAANTTVPLERSIAEIIGLLRKAGAERIAQLEEPDQFTVQFFMSARMIRFRVKLPPLTDMPTHDGRNSRLSDAQRREKQMQHGRQRGRALMLVVKAKLESVESEVETPRRSGSAARHVLRGAGASVMQTSDEALARMEALVRRMAERKLPYTYMSEDRDEACEIVA